MTGTKKSLLASGLSLLASCALLAGTTFAWFTDSVTNTGNKIQAGKLEVALFELQANGTYQEVGDTPIFSYDRWEPGYSDVAVLKVENQGTLALKYRVDIVANGENSAELTKLAEAIDVYALLNQNTAITKIPTGTDGMTNLGSLKDVLVDGTNVVRGNLKKTEADYAAIVLKMRETAGNEYQGLAAGVTFDIVLKATQDTVETDGFGSSDYDTDATYPDGYEHWDGQTVDTSWYTADEDTFSIDTPAALAGLKEVTRTQDTSGQTFTLTNNIDLEGNALQISNLEGTFDGDGHEIKGISKTLFTSPKGTNEQKTVIRDVTLTGNTSGAIVSSSPKYVVFENVTTTGSAAVSKGGSAFVSGVVYVAAPDQEEYVVEFNGCTNRADVTGSSYQVGAFVGYVRAPYGGSSNGKQRVAIRNCVNSGNISTAHATGNAGGLAGLIVHTDVEGCINTGTISAPGYVGGLVGSMNGGCTLINSYNTGDVVCTSEAGQYVGGIVGVETAGSKLQYCINYGQVTGGVAPAGVSGGAGAGWTSHLDNFYLEGTADYGHGLSMNSEDDPTRSRLDVEGHFEKKTEAQLKSVTTFAGWDAEIWNFMDGAYPTLKAQG